MSNRRLVAEAAFGSGPFDDLTAVTWTDLGAVRSAQWTLGRDDELGPFEPTTASLVLRNRDRRLDPDYTAGPYYGSLLPRVPVRIRSQDTDALVFADEWYGFVTSGWRVDLAPKGQVTSRIDLVDRLGTLSGWTLPDVFEQAVLDQSPVGFWVLDRADAEMVPDLSGRGNDGTVVGEGVKAGDRVIKAGHAPAARFDIEIDAASGKRVFGHIDIGRSPVIDPAGLWNTTVVATFQARSVAELNWRTVFVQDNGDANSYGFIAVIENDGTFRFGLRTKDTGSSAGWASDMSVVDGKAHIVFASRTRVAVDSAADVAGVSASDARGGTNGVGIGGHSGIQARDHMDGWIGAVAVFDRALFAGERPAILDGYSKLDGSRTDEQIAWALGHLGVPAAHYDLDVGTVIMGPAATKGRDALQWIEDVVATEQGEFYVDHRDGGTLRFRHRYARHLATPSTTSQATFSDEPAVVGVIRYPAEGLDIAANGLDSIVNTVTVRWADGEITHTDTASVDAYGPRTHTIETAATTPAQARSVAEWLVARRKDPKSRIRGATASRRTFTGRDDLVQGLEVGDRVTFRVHPTGLDLSPVGSATSVDLWVEAVSHSAQGVEWETSFRFSPVDDLTPWVWGTNEWNVDAYWG